MNVTMFVVRLCLLSLLQISVVLVTGYKYHGTCILRGTYKKRDIDEDVSNHDDDLKRAYTSGYSGYHEYNSYRKFIVRLQVLHRCGYNLCNSHSAKIYIYTNKGRKQHCYNSLKYSKKPETVSCLVYGYPVKIVVLWPKYKRAIKIYRLKRITALRIVMPKKRLKILKYSSLGFCKRPKSHGTSQRTILITDAVQGKTCPTGRLRFPVGSVQSFKTRTFDGRLNNKKNIFAGAVGDNLLKLTGNGYVDDISVPSGACTAYQRKQDTCPFPKENNGTGSNRPNPRVISNFLMAQNKPINSRRGLSDLAAYFGQFIDHDMDLTEELPRKEIQINPNDLELPIPVPKGDVIFDADSKGNQTIPVRRFIFDKCTGNAKCKCPRSHINSISSVLDANNVYGSIENRSKVLRTFKDGLLKSDNGNLPLNIYGVPNANAIKRDATKLRLAGDVRANVAPTLLALHTLFMREHNRLAKLYKKIHSKAADEEIFQYARKIVIAETQAITFREYIPAVLGGTYRIPKYRGYNPKVDPMVANEFSTAAFRFGHTQINSKIFRYEKSGKISRYGHILLREGFFRPERVTNEGGIDQIFRGSVRHPTQEIDVKMVDELRNFMFPKKGVGLDLAAINIQRGRETGIPDYNTVRQKLGLKKLTSFGQITRNKRIASKLKHLYASVDNLDLWVAGIAEDHEKGSEIGETFRKIFVNQFVRVRDGDRFWYERILTRKEIDYVHRHTLSKIMELNTGLHHVDKNVFFSSDVCREVRNFQCIRHFKYRCS